MTRLLSLILLCVRAVCRSGAVSPPGIADSDHVSTLIGLSSDSLLAMADRWNEHHVMTDSALICYTIVANRYQRAPAFASQALLQTNLLLPLSLPLVMSLAQQIL